MNRKQYVAILVLQLHIFVACRAACTPKIEIHGIFFLRKGKIHFVTTSDGYYFIFTEYLGV
jgi:hypothetical protein